MHTNIIKTDNPKFLIINIIVILFPISFVAGNLFINLNTALLIFFFLFFFRSEFKSFNFNFFDKLIFIFFLFSLFVTIINLIEYFFFNKDFSFFILKKSILHFRYFILYLVLRILLEKKIINIKYLILSSSICSLLVVLDIFIQFLYGENVFGMKPISSRHFSGLFGEELIAGGYLQKFGFILFFLPILYFKNNYIKFVLQTIIFISVAIAIIFSGNRMPLILFIFLIFIYFFIFNKKILIYYIVFFLIIFFSFLNKYNFIKYNFGNFYQNSLTIIQVFSKYKSDDSFIYNQNINKPYVLEFFCGQYIWKKNPIIGGGIKSYRVNSHGCNSHPHNYYLEILVDLGLVGLFIFLILFTKILINLFNIKKLIYYNKNNIVFFPFFLILIIELFPIRSSGSFFSTGNATLIFIFLALAIHLIDNKKIKV